MPHPRPRRPWLLGGLALSFAVVAVAEAKFEAQGAARPAQALVIDHRAIAEFGRLTGSQTLAAAKLRFLLRTASIGWGIDQGLNCLMNNFPDRKRRPYACDKGIPAEDVLYGAKYDRRSWVFEIRGNPGWYGKVSDFVDRLDRPKGPETFDVVGFNFNYSDGVAGSDILDHFFSTTAGGKVGNVATLEALEKRHQDKTFVWWTMALPRQSGNTMQEFNQRLRAYAVKGNKVLFDLADIQSHRADGSACVDNQGTKLEAICQDYTDERNSGHLNARGGQRLAKAVWVLMARLAEQGR